MEKLMEEYLKDKSQADFEHDLEVEEEIKLHLLSSLEIEYLEKKRGCTVVETNDEESLEKTIYRVKNSFVDHEGTAEEIRQQHGLYGCTESWLN